MWIPWGWIPGKTKHGWANICSLGMKNRSFWGVFFFFGFKANKTGTRTEHRWENGICVLASTKGVLLSDRQQAGCAGQRPVGELTWRPRLQVRRPVRRPPRISRTFYRVLAWLWLRMNKNGRWLIASFSSWWPDEWLAQRENLQTQPGI